MQTLIFDIKEKTKIPFLIELLSNFDFIQNVKVGDILELIEEEGLVRAMKIAENENEFLNREEALKFLDND